MAKGKEKKKQFNLKIIIHQYFIQKQKQAEKMQNSFFFLLSVKILFISEMLIMI